MRVSYFFRWFYTAYNDPQRKEDIMKKYGFWNFIGDVLMCLITGGLWLIWIFVREMRRNNR